MQATLTTFSDQLKEDKYCKKEKSDSTNWKSRIIEHGTETNCTGTNLYKNIKNKKEDVTGSYIKKVKKASWTVANCNPTQFPIQAHHLIPKSHLPKHPVCVFLAKNYAEHEIYQLTADNNYDTDDTQNGYCLPYASPTTEWKATKNLSGSTQAEARQKVAFDVMDNTNRQLHQGSHAKEVFEEVDEEEGIEQVTPYLEAVDQFLDAIHDCARDHVRTCTVCKSAGDDKINIQPVASIVQHMHEASKQIYTLLLANKIFVSKYAYQKIDPIGYQRDLKKNAQ